MYTCKTISVSLQDKLYLKLLIRHKVKIIANVQTVLLYNIK